MIKQQNNSEKTIPMNPNIIPMNPNIIPMNPENDSGPQKSDSSVLFSCNLCNKTFTLKTNLARHRKNICKKSMESTKSTNENEFEIIKQQLREQQEKIKELEEHAKIVSFFINAMRT